MTRLNTSKSIVASAAGGDFSLILDGHGNFWASGTNASGQLGIGSSAGFTNAPSLVAAGHHHHFAAGKPFCQNNLRQQRSDDLRPHLAATNLLTALSNWVTLANLPVGHRQPAQFMDIMATNYPVRFYRAARPQSLSD
ncbi:MAG TPA: hypothetical protein VGO59_00775 [Verrucomicrobiae bacterium]